ncbi:MAG: precorrin-6A/cobalt-precorrin-6A reductase [Pseudomonadota bacterium]
MLLTRVTDVPVLASLAGRTAHPVDLGVATRVGGFGGADGFRAALSGIRAVLDATHPFAARISDRTARICAQMSVPYLRLSRPPWPDAPGWRHHPSAEDCAKALPAGARVFLSTGPGSLRPFLGRGLHLVCRRVDPAPQVAGVTWVIGTPPFQRVQESALFAHHGITHLVTKNAGGARAKLDAADQMDIAVHMIDRPPIPVGEETHDIAQAEAFLRAHADHP